MEKYQGVAITDGLADVRDLEPVYTKSENGEKGFLVQVFIIKMDICSLHTSFFAEAYLY